MQYWQQLHLTVDQSTVDVISDFFTEHQALLISLSDAKDQPLFEPAPGETPMWSKVELVALFDDKQDLSQLMRHLQQHIGEQHISAFHQTQLSDRDWQQACQQQFPAMQIGKRLCIYPSWESADDSAQTAKVILDPGLAFGTGQHPTTALCLEWLDQHIKGGEILIDYGCGSGILAIAAIKLGCQQVIAIDNDPQALQATDDNARRNQLSSEQLLTCLPEAIPTIEADMLVANILAKPLIALKDRFIRLLKPHGNIALSGLLATQLNDIHQHYQVDVDLQAAPIRNEWALTSGQKRQ